MATHPSKKRAGVTVPRRGVTQRLSSEPDEAGPKLRGNRSKPRLLGAARCGDNGVEPMSALKKFSEANLVAVFGAESAERLFRLQDIFADEENRLVRQALEGPRAELP